MSHAPAAALTEERDLALARDLADAAAQIRREIKKRVVGQDLVIEQLLIALFSKSHGLFVGVPGLAKTLLIQTLAEALGLVFNRIQFTPDLMPSDITGTDVLEEDKQTGTRTFRFIPGPIFANVVLADEINRTPPKTQAALLQAMAEHKVTAGGRTFPLELPFLVFATQNPIEQEGTYPLPEAQLDRFMFLIDVGYPTREEEEQIVRMTTAGTHAPVQSVVAVQRIIELQELVRRVPVPPHVIEYAVALVRATRPGEADVIPEVKDWVSFGAGPRASQSLILGAKARAVLHGRFAASIEDVIALARPILVHRVLVNFRAEAGGKTSRDVIEAVIQKVKRG